MEEKIRKILFENQDLKYKKFHSGLCPNTDNIIGVRVPVLRKIAKEIIKEETNIKYLEKYDMQYYEEKILYGVLIGKSRISLEDCFKYLKKFIPEIDNWAVCDITCAELKVTKKNLEKVWEFLENYINSDKEFETRFALVMYLDYYLNEIYIDKVLNKLDKLKNNDYYTKMAIAWLISVAYVKQKEKTMKFLKSNHLDKWTYNKSLQKIVESNRVSEEEKDLIKNMKIK